VRAVLGLSLLVYSLSRADEIAAWVLARWERRAIQRLHLWQARRALATGSFGEAAQVVGLEERFHPHQQRQHQSHATLAPQQTEVAAGVAAETSSSQDSNSALVGVSVPMFSPQASRAAAASERTARLAFVSSLSTDTPADPLWSEALSEAFPPPLVKRWAASRPFPVSAILLFFIPDFSASRAVSLVRWGLCDTKTGTLKHQFVRVQQTTPAATAAAAPASTEKGKDDAPAAKPPSGPGVVQRHPWAAMRLWARCCSVATEFVARQRCLHGLLLRELEQSNLAERSASLSSVRVGLLSGAAWWLSHSLAFAREGGADPAELLRLRAQLVATLLASEQYPHAQTLAADSLKLSERLLRQLQGSASSSTTPSPAATPATGTEALFPPLRPPRTVAEALERSASIADTLGRQALFHAQMAEIAQRQQQYGFAAQHWDRALKNRRLQAGIMAQGVVRQTAPTQAPPTVPTQAPVPGQKMAAAADSASPLLGAQVFPPPDVSEMFMLQQFGHCVLAQAQLSPTSAPLASAHALPLALTMLHCGCVSLHRGPSSASCAHCQSIARALRLRSALTSVQAEQTGLVAEWPASIAAASAAAATMLAAEKASALAPSEPASPDAAESSAPSPSDASTPAAAHPPASLSNEAQLRLGALSLRHTYHSLLGTAGVAMKERLEGATLLALDTCLASGHVLKDSRLQGLLMTVPTTAGAAIAATSNQSLDPEQAQSAAADGATATPIASPAVRASLPATTSGSLPPPPSVAVTPAAPVPSAQQTAAAAAAAKPGTRAEASMGSWLREQWRHGWRSSAPLQLPASSLAPTTATLLSPSGLVLSVPPASVAVPLSAAVAASTASLSGEEKLQLNRELAASHSASLLNAQLVVSRSYLQLARVLSAAGDPATARALELAQEATSTAWLREVLPPEPQANYTH